MWNRQFRVLVVDDDAGDVELLRRQLSLITEWKSEVVHVADAGSITALTEREQPDVVFIDLRLGAKCGIDVVKTLRRFGYMKPVLMLTGQGSESLVKECLISGADDYLDKNALNPAMLRRSLQHANAQYLHRKAEVKLRLIRFSIDHASDPVLWARKDGRFTYVNDAACQMLSYSQGAFLSLKAQDITSFIRREGWNTIWNRIKCHGAATCEDTLRNHDGSTVPVELRVNYVRWKKIERACVFVRDLRDRRKSEAELHDKEEQLRHKQQLEAVGSLAGGVAHEFNNLLQAIRGFTLYAMEGLDPDEQRRQDLDQVISATDRAVTLTHQLLGFSRRQVLEQVFCDPNEVISDLVKMLRPVMGEHIDLELSLAPDSGRLFADRYLLLQMLLNLCINARDAMPAGGVLTMATERINLSKEDCELHPTAKPGDYVIFSVTDTGCGMPPEVKGRIFEPFFTTKDVGKGTGLGLSMVYGGVQQHGGIVDVHSAPNLGTTFKIYLPIATIGDCLVDKAATAPAIGGQELILIAEDEPMVRDLEVRILTRAGYSVLVAGDGAQAVELFEANADDVSLIVLDAIMPKLTGQQAYQRIKLRNPDVPVIFCSGYDPETGQVKLLVDEGVRMVQKPFDPDLLLRTVREALGLETRVGGVAMPGINRNITARAIVFDDKCTSNVKSPTRTTFTFRLIESSTATGEEAL